MLNPGITVTIDRIKPAWCAGWQEDYLLDSDDIGELRQYIKDEYGGQVFRLTAMAAGGAPLWVSKMTIGGKPREDGRTLRRWEYEGEPNPAAQQARPPATLGEPDAAAGINIMGVLTLVLDSNRAAATAQLEAVRETVTSSNKAIQSLMNTIVVERSEEKRGGDFAGQLKSLVESTKALKKAGSFFGAADGGPAQTSGGDGMLTEATRHAFERFVGNVIDSEMGDGPKRPDRVRRPPQRRPAGAGGDGIPDAIRRPEPPN